MNRFAALGKNKTAVYLLIFIIALLLRLYNIEYRSVWMDEDQQSRYSERGLFDLDMPHNSSRLAQPPVDPWIQSVGISNFGMSEIGIRLHSAILGALSVLLFYILIGKIIGRVAPATKDGMLPADKIQNGERTRFFWKLLQTYNIESRFAVFLASVIFAFHPWLIRYSQEARPVGTGVFFAVLYLFLLLDFLVHARDKKTNTRTYIFLIIVQTWFLLSIGFQPLIFILISSLSLLPFLFSKKYFYKTALVYLSGLISFSFAYPILKLSIAAHSSSYLTNASILHQVTAVFKKLISFKFIFESYINFYKHLVGEYDILCLIVLILGVAGLIHALISRKKNATALLFLYFLIFALAYPPVFSSIFKTLIKYHMYVRYYLSFTPVLIAGLAVGLYYALFFLSLLLKNKYKLSTPIRYLPHVFLLIVFLFSFYGNTQDLKRMYSTKFREWEKLYEIFKYHSAPGDTAYIVNLANPGQWVPTYFYAQKLYYSDETERYVRLKGKGIIVEDYQNIRTGKQRGNIYFVFLKGNLLVKKSFFKNLDEIQFHRFRYIFVVRLLNNKSLPENILDFYYCLADNLPKRKSSYIVYETLFNLELANGRLMKAKQHLDTLVKFDTGGKLKAKIEEFKKRWQSKIKKRERIIEKRKNKKN